jgi:hypothetical protein
MGNKPRKQENPKILNEIVFEDKTYALTEYSAKKKIDCFNDFNKLEQEFRNRSWDIEQVDSSDILFEIPSKSIKSIEKASNISEININNIRSVENDRLFVLSGYTNIDASQKEEMLIPDNFIKLGKRFGKEVSEISQNINNSKITHISSREGDVLPGAEVKIESIKIRPLNNISAFKISKEKIPVIGEYDNLIVGGGTAGAPAAISSAKYGSKTLIVEYLHGLGGMMTLGMIGRYWHGYREGYTKKIDKEIREMGPENHPRQKKSKNDWVKDSKMEYFRSEILKNEGEIWFGAIVCGAIVENNNVKGVVLATPYGKKAVLSKKIIDSTGSADVAIAAGAKYEYTSGNSVAIQGCGLPPVNPNDHYNNTDWTFTDDTDVFDVTRTFVAAKQKGRKGYEIGKLPQTRERRRIIGDFTVGALDMANDRKYEDTLSVHVSSFDTHGFTIDPYFIIKPPAGSSVDMFAKVPLRSLLPQGLENIIVTGLGASAHRDAMPVIRMQPCLQNQGYSVGILATLANKEDKSFRNCNFKEAQSIFIKEGTLPDEAANWKDSYPPAPENVKEAVKAIPYDFEKLEVALWNKEMGIKFISEEYEKSLDKEIKRKYAVILSYYGIDKVWKDLVDYADSYKIWDKGWDYTGMGQFGMSCSYLDAIIMGLGKTGKQEALPAIDRLAKMLKPDSEFSHFRAVAEAYSEIKSEDSAIILSNLLNLEGVKGHAKTSYSDAKEVTNSKRNDTLVRNSCLKELFVVRALFECGDVKGEARKILIDYANDLRGHYGNYAMGVLGIA